MTLIVNSLGEPDDRARYVEALRDHFVAVGDGLSEQSRATLERNPLRVLDSKREVDQVHIDAAPQIADFHSDEAAAHFAAVLAGLRALDIPFTIEPKLVRGLDYYRRTIFEFQGGTLDSAQNALGGGGRYDGLVEALGGPATPGVGFALGVDRTLLACDDEGVFGAEPVALDAFVVDVTGGLQAVALTAELRAAGFAVDRGYDNRSMKAQMKLANRSGARFALIVGDDELAAGTVVVKPMQADGAQVAVARNEISTYLASIHDRIDLPMTDLPASTTSSSQATSMRTHLCGELRPDHIGQTVSMCGWVGRRREHGEHLAFVDLRDHSGIVQCVINDDVDVRSEYVLRVTGVVRERPEGTINENLPTGRVELGECQVEVLRKADPPPFPIDARADSVDENIRLQHRYLDLRRERMQKNLRVRAAINAAVRAGMERQGFVEVETPMLVPSTPEGAREFLVPSRKEPGSFYALPQSPQLFKQLLMVGGVDRYYQMARCLRDEDLRADRQYEFMQLDMEMSFVTQDDVLDAVSEAVLDAAEAATGERPQPIERITWHEAMDRYGIDKPDLRFGLELVELTPLFASTEFKAFAGAGAIKGIRVPGAAGEYGRNQLDKLTDRAKSLGAKGLVWLKVTDDGFDSPVAKFLSADEAAAVRSAMGSETGDLILIVADEWMTTCEVLGTLRNDIGRPPVHEGPYRYVWVVEFPLFVGVDKETGRPKPGHHPFTTPHPDDLDKIETDPLSVRSIAYDLVLNGWELGSGSIRIHEPELQRRVFKALGISDEEAERKFGFFLNPFDYGAPPHGGFAFGLDRLVAILAGEENIREVIAFPKTQSGQDPMTNSPIPGDPKALAELGLKVLPPAT